MLCYSEDRFEISEKSQRVRTSDGYMTVPAAIARTGIQKYRARDMRTIDGQAIFADKNPDDVINVYRPSDEVGAQDAIRSFENAPITLGHPDTVTYPNGVTADCWATLAKGHATDCAFDKKDRLVKATLHVRDAEAIRAIDSGVVGMSAGYRHELVRLAGVDPDTGESYDAVQTNIRANHIAIVQSGRGGPKVRVADEDTQPKESPMKRNVQVEGVAYSLDETEATLVETLVKKLTASQDALATAQTKHGEAVTALTAEFGTKIKALEAQVVTTEQLEALVQDRATVLGDCERLCPTVKREGTTGQIRRAMLADITGKSQHAKRVLDAVLVGVALDAADDGTVKVALGAVIAAQSNDEITERRRKQASDLANPSIREGGTPKGAKSAEDVPEFSYEAAQKPQQRR